MELPQLLPECDHKNFCPTCRDREAGRGFRQSILAHRGIEFDVDFDCPKKKPWSLRTHVGLGDLIEKATSAVGIKTCGGCSKRKRIANKIQIRLPWRHKEEVK